MAHNIMKTQTQIITIYQIYQWGALHTVDEDIVDYDYYVQNCDEHIYKLAGGKNITPDSLCKALFQNILHSGGSTQVVAVVKSSGN